MKVTITFFILLFSFFSNAQGWENVGTAQEDIIYDMIKFDNRLFAGGRIWTRTESWDGMTWTPHPGINSLSAVLTFCVLNDTLYAGGGNHSSSPQSHIYKYNGGSWEQIAGSFAAGSWSQTQKLIVYDSLLISGGYFWTVDGVPTNNIAAWNGSSWAPMGAGLDNTVLFLEVHNNTLYATGQFMASGGDTTVRNIAKWNGVSWDCFDTNVVFTTANALKSYQGDLLIGNVWNNISGVDMKGITRWDGTNYTSMGDTLIKKVHEFWEFNNELFIAVDLFGSSPWIIERVVMKWNGVSWDQIGTMFDEWIMCLEDYDNMLYCGGQFDTPTSHIGRYNPTLGLSEFSIDDKKVIKVVDLMGRETKDKPNTLLIYIYNDGTTKKVFRVE